MRVGGTVYPNPSTTLAPSMIQQKYPSLNSEHALLKFLLFCFIKAIAIQIGEA